jgi:hypothetical protein
MSPAARPLAQDALVTLLTPIWQLVIGALVLVAVLASVRTFVRRGPSRMTTALIVTALAIIGLTTIGVLLSGD